MTQVMRESREREQPQETCFVIPIVLAESPIRTVGTLSSNPIQLTSSTFFRMGTHHQIPLRGPGRTVNQLRRFYGAERERQRRNAAARARAAQAAIATIAVALAAAYAPALAAMAPAAAPSAPAPAAVTAPAAFMAPAAAMCLPRPRPPGTRGHGPFFQG